MTPKTALLMLVVVLSGCAAQRRYAGSHTLVLTEKSPGVYLGHSEDGKVVIAATHYDAMNGLAVEDTDLGLEKRKDASGAMICRREVPTGSHVPHWMCRYTDDIAHERQLTLNTLQQPLTSFSAGGGQGVSMTQGSGSASRTQQR